MATKKRAAEAATTTSASAGTRQEALVRLASKRVGKALKALDLVGNLAAYKPTEAQVKSIMTALDARLQELDGRFKGTTKQAAGFKL